METIKSLGLLNKSGGCIVVALAENQIVKHDTKSFFENFKFLFRPGREVIDKTSKATKPICN